MSDEQDVTVESGDDRWIGCGCEECRKIGNIICKIEPVIIEIKDGLEKADYEFAASVVDQLAEAFVAMSTIHVSGVMQAASIVKSIGDYILWRAQEIQMQNIVRSEVTGVLNKMMRPIGMVKVQGAMPPGAPDPGKEFCPGCGGDDDDKGGSKLH